MSNKNTTQKECLIVVRDENRKIIAIINRIDGEQKYEIYSTTTASIDEIIELLNSDKLIANKE